MNSPIVGVQFLFAGFDLITKPGLKRFVIIPLLINVGLFIGLFFFLRHYIGIFDSWFESLLPTWLHWLSYLLWLLFLAGFLLIIFYLFIAVTNFIAAPFNSLLAEKVELYLTGQAIPQRSLFENIKDVPRILGRQLALIGYYLPRVIILLLLFFVPVVQAVAAILWFLFNAWFVAMTYMDYPTDNHRVPLLNVRLFLQQKRWAAFGFGAAVLILMTIPVVNFLTMPAAVAGATKFWLEFRPKNG